MYCRGHATRIEIIETYKLVPLGRFKGNPQLDRVD